MNLFSSFKFMIKQLSPCFLEIRKGYIKNPLLPGPYPVVPLDSIELTSEVIMLSWVFGTLTSHVQMGVTKGGF